MPNITDYPDMGLRTVLQSGCPKSNAYSTPMMALPGENSPDGFRLYHLGTPLRHFEATDRTLRRSIFVPLLCGELKQPNV
ncbi:hypothetical protein TNCV_2136671 [Trichonephila clavipes]|nr:hypothetical protein TNCV_2136671 [Trichonephila clavipes]